MFHGSSQLSVKLLMVSKIAAAESSTATGALGPPMSVVTQPGCIAANKIPVFIMSKSLAKAKKFGVQGLLEIF